MKIRVTGRDAINGESPELAAIVNNLQNEDHIHFTFQTAEDMELFKINNPNLARHTFAVEVDADQY